MTIGTGSGTSPPAVPLRRPVQQDDRHPADELGPLAVLELAEEGAVDRDHPRRAVGHERAALAVDDQPALGLHDDLADRLRGGLGGVLLAGDDLEVERLWAELAA